MKTAAVIAEYNPFHNGHFYQLQEIRRQTGADFIIVVMSGDFVQRGEPAVFDKYTRARMALSGGADLILELPIAYATGSAADFAAGATALLDSLGVVDLLCFGSESGDLESLKAAAGLLSSESEAVSAQIRQGLRQGMTYPAARSAAFSAIVQTTQPDDAVPKVTVDDFTHLLAGPNNILALSYLNALQSLQSTIQPYTIRRCGQGYHHTTLSDTEYASASGLRTALESLLHSHASSASLTELLARHIPQAAMDALLAEDALRAPVFTNDLSILLNAEIIRLFHVGEDFSRFADLTTDLANRLLQYALSFDSFTGRIRQLKTRSYTYTRVSRALLHLLLGITFDSIREYKEQGFVSYVRVLGFRRSAAPLLSALSRQCTLPLITRIAGAQDSLDAVGASMLRQELHASHLYQSLVFQKGRTMKNEYTKSVLVIS
ncbi:MAG: nucleotidyltransferase family protein [Clostridiales bacterium]|nr:nucleotidyltransferase family protein [Clostridiales bacterium]